MLFLPMLIVVGALAVLAGGSRPQDAAPVVPVVTGRQRRFPAGPPVARPATSPARAAPSAVAILMEFVRLRRRPPPALISSALAEAQRAGQDELAMAIVDTYIRPVVDAAERGGYREDQGDDYYARAGEPAPAQDPYAYPPPPYAPPPYVAPYPASPYAAPPAQSIAPPMPSPMPTASPEPTHPAYPTYPTYPSYLPPGATAPSGGYDASPGSPGGSAPPPGPWAPASGPGPGAAPAPMVPLGASDDDILRMIERLSVPPSQVPAAPAPGSFDPAAPLEGPPSSTGPGTITVSGRSSPIDGIGTTEWSRFCDRMSRELPTYTSAHHVGQFRQRRGRLLELGIDPETVLTSPEHQRTAFDVDMSEAYRRAHAAGLLACVGHPVEVPVQDGPSQVAQVTTSGVLAVVQAAGVEGALGWFRTPQDRRRFAGTTAVFSRANGVF